MRTAGLTSDSAPRCLSNTCSQAHAESSQDLSRQIIDFIPKTDFPIFVNIDKTGFHSTAILLII